MQPPLLLRNESGHFVRVVPGEVFQNVLGRPRRRFRDIDNDGDIDVVVSNAGQNAYVLRNDGGNRKTGSALRPSARNRTVMESASRVKVVSASGLTQYFTVNTAVGYLSASDKRLLVGLGTDSTAKLVEIRGLPGLSRNSRTSRRARR